MKIFTRGPHELQFARRYRNTSFDSGDVDTYGLLRFVQIKDCHTVDMQVAAIASFGAWPL